jgi:hypothetical protein
MLCLWLWKTEMQAVQCAVRPPNRRLKHKACLLPGPCFNIVDSFKSVPDLQQPSIYAPRAQDSIAQLLLLAHFIIQNTSMHAMKWQRHMVAQSTLPSSPLRNNNELKFILSRGTSHVLINAARYRYPYLSQRMARET